MVRLAGMVVATVVAVFAIGGICAYQEVMTLEVVPVTDDVSVIQGSIAGNVGVLRTEAGSVVVDTMVFQMQGRRIRELAEDVAGPTQAIVNTHYHLDHTHGNPAFASGAKVVATRRTLGYMKLLDGDYWQGAAAGTLPNETFDETHELKLGGKTVRLFHPGRGHTDGDLVVLFVEDRVVHTGDLFFNGRYPNIDLEAGGSVREWSASIDRILALEFDHVIPGHGPVTDAEGLRAFQRFVEQLADVGATAARDGTSLADTQAGAALDADAGYEVLAIPLVMSLDRDFVIRRAWEEATGNFERAALPEETPVKDLFSIEGKVALVTGGSRGIGLMIARGFVEAGANVYISSRKAEVCEEVAADLSKLGSCAALPADVGTEVGANKLASAFAERESRLHVLVNNAGANWGAPMAEFPDAAWDKVLALNVKGVFHLTRALLPQLEAASAPGDPARVINIGSIDGIQVPLLDTFSYSASKAAVHHLTRVLAAKLAPGITVNAVAPGPFESKMMAATLEQFGDSIAANAPLKRIGEPEDMAGVAIYLASRAGAYLTGAIIPVDGGISTTR